MTQVCCTSPFLFDLVRRMAERKNIPQTEAEREVKESIREVVAEDGTNHSPEWKLLRNLAFKLGF